ncbi:uncharacterized protein LOC116193699 isoform X3 [Punica granatum]|uniref:Protein RFT1 homolog n=1 Tax=Punica granatum TaxID=22663 RepID=A0A6P8CB26_PUNGR|nr:uncharacterized protein LOC116193699 isoform X3 [Punica granatum]
MPARKKLKFKINYWYGQILILAAGSSFFSIMRRNSIGNQWRQSGKEARKLRDQVAKQQQFLFALKPGTSEAFLHAVADKNQLICSNASLFAFSWVNVLLNVLLIHSAGAVGLIIADFLSMFLRIACSGAFIRQYFQEQDPFHFVDIVVRGLSSTESSVSGIMWTDDSECEDRPLKM